jgi:hypothetical protein
MTTYDSKNKLPASAEMIQLAKSGKVPYALLDEQTKETLFSDFQTTFQKKVILILEFILFILLFYLFYPISTKSTKKMKNSSISNHSWRQLMLAQPLRPATVVARPMGSQNSLI